MKKHDPVAPLIGSPFHKSSLTGSVIISSLGQYFNQHDHKTH